jgi:hypothetical protein
MSLQKHSLEDIWQRQEADRRLILETRETVAAMGSKLDAVINALNTITTNMARPPTPTNWVGIASLVVAVMVATGGYIQSRFSPVEQMLELHDHEVRAQTANSGQTTAELAALRRDVDRLYAKDARGPKYDATLKE